MVKQAQRATLSCPTGPKSVARDASYQIWLWFVPEIAERERVRRFSGPRHELYQENLRAGKITPAQAEEDYGFKGWTDGC